MTPTAETLRFVLTSLREDAGQAAVMIRQLLCMMQSTDEFNLTSDKLIDTLDRVASWAELAQQVAGREDER